MSTPMPSDPTPIHEFQSHFGTAPGLPDPVAECKKWENLCGELLAERQKLREDLANAETERDRYLKSLYHFVGKDYVCPYTDEEMLACVDREAPLRELIADLQLDMGNGT
jgi:hypothetical protein